MEIGESAFQLPAWLIWPIGIAIVLALIGGLIWIGARWWGWSVRGKRIGGSDPRSEHEGERRRAGEILRIGSQLNAALASEQVPELLLDLGYAALADGLPGEDDLTGALLLAEEAGLRLVAGRELSDADLGALLPGRNGVLGEALRRNEPSLTRYPLKDPEIGEMASLQGCREAVCVPLVWKRESHGVLLFAHPEEHFFDRQRIELLQAVGAQATTALQNARIYRDLELERDRITETEEEARRKLARDLHDGPTQTIAAIAMRLNYARRLIDRDPAAAGDEIHRLEDIARQTTREIRHMLFTLRPLVLESKGLVAALRQLASKMEETHDQAVAVEADPNIAQGLDMRVQAVAFFIAEEAINNAWKHAEAEHIQVRLRKLGEERLVLEVQDDGVGFNVGAVDAHYEQRGSLGMVNMRERADLIAASLRIESSEGKGTHLILELPLLRDEDGRSPPRTPRRESTHDD